MSGAPSKAREKRPSLWGNSRMGRVYKINPLSLYLVHLCFLFWIVSWWIHTSIALVNEELKSGCAVGTAQPGFQIPNRGFIVELQLGS